MTFGSPAGVFVRVFYSEREQFLGLRVGLAAQPRDALTDTEMLVTAGAGDLGGLYPDDDELDAALYELADRLQRYGDRALSGDPRVFDEARALRRKHTEHYTAPPGE